MLSWFEHNDYDIKGISAKEMAELDADNDYEVSRIELRPDQVDEANVWCLMGALEEVTYRLGIISSRHSSDRLESPISLRTLVQSKEEWQNWTVIDVNDNAKTTFETIRGLLDERIAQLKGETVV